MKWKHTKEDQMAWKIGFALTPTCVSTEGDWVWLQQYEYRHIGAVTEYREVGNETTAPYRYTAMP